MKKALPRQPRTSSVAAYTQKALLPLFAVGGSLAAAQAHAIELGDATVHSQLGQPLRASIALALAPNEQLFDSCVSLGMGPSGLPGIGRATISITDGALLLTGSTPIREPLVAANIFVDCPSAARVAREYMMFIDPAGSPTGAAPVVETTAATQAAPANVAPSVSSAATPAENTTTGSAKPASRRAPPTSSQQPVGKSTRYRVQPGDSLSEITQRIENRRMGLWAAVNLIFEANPEAFIDNDPNKLKAGSWLTIPSFDGNESVVAGTAAPVATGAAAEPVTTSDFVPIDFPEPESAAPTVQEELAESATPAVQDELRDYVATDDTTADLRPGALDVTEDDALTEVPVAAGETISIPDTALAGPQTSSTSPNVAAATAQPRPHLHTSSWLWWLAGSGAAIVLALLLFGRTLRGRFGSTPFDIANDELPIPDAPTEEDALALKAALNYDIEDNAPTAENPELDADLVIGTGLNFDNDAGATEDVDFPSPTVVDFELPAASDAASAAVEQPMRSASMSTSDMILESEILPDRDDDPDADDVDVSVILDATKMPQPDDKTQPNPEAIEQDEMPESTVEQPRDIVTDIDLTILEQDYEDEFSATQVLQLELTQAAQKLVQDMDLDMSDAAEISMDEDATAEMSLASLSDDDVKHGLDAGNDSDAVALEELTLGMFGEEETVEIPKVDEDKTRKMPRRDVKMNKKAG